MSSGRTANAASPGLRCRQPPAPAFGVWAPPGGWLHYSFALQLDLGREISEMSVARRRW